MSDVYCISYSDFGYLLSSTNWKINIRKLDGFDYGVYEDILKSNEISIYRRFLANLPSVFDSDNEKTPEPTLPNEITRFVMTYKDTEVVVIGSYEYQVLFADKEKDENGFVCINPQDLNCAVCNVEDLAEDVVILASNGIDLNQANDL